MSRLMGQLFADSPLLIWPIVSLAIFGLTFGAVLITTLRRKAPEIAELSAIPLQDDEPGDRS